MSSIIFCTYICPFKSKYNIHISKQQKYSTLTILYKIMHTEMIMKLWTIDKATTKTKEKNYFYLIFSNIFGLKFLSFQSNSYFIYDFVCVCVRVTKKDGIRKRKEEWVRNAGAASVNYVLLLLYLYFVHICGLYCIIFTVLKIDLRSARTYISIWFRFKNILLHIR